MYKKISMLLLAVFTAATAHPVMAQNDDRGPAAARLVVENYYKAIDTADYRAAYRLWGEGGGGGGSASGKTFAVFRHGFASTTRSRVVTGAPTNGDAGAGSIYIDVPVEVFATLKDGRKQHFRGKYTLRRVNDVDGATQEQLDWHIASATLRLGR